MAEVEVKLHIWADKRVDAVWSGVAEVEMCLAFCTGETARLDEEGALHFEGAQDGVMKGAANDLGEEDIFGWEEVEDGLE